MSFNSGTKLPLLEITRTDGKFVRDKSCFVHARIGALDDKNFVMTLQELDISGRDNYIFISKVTSQN